MSARPLTPGQVVDLTIERLAQGGSGVARLDGFVVFTPYTAPFDKIRARIQSVKKTFATAALVELIEAGPSRVKPPCPYFGSCGGCNLQHVSYEEQLRQKEGFVNYLLKNTSAVIEPIQASPIEFRYRNRVQVHLREGQSGFLKRGSHEIIDIKDCLIADERLIPNIKALKKMKGEGKFEIGIGRDEKVYSINLNNEPYEFTQVNRAQNQSMIDYVLKQTESLKVDRVFDLYCGSGNFTIPLAKRFPSSSVTGVEENSQAIQKAISLSGTIKNVEFLASDTAAFVRKNKNLAGSLVVLDPPRAGCAPEVIDALLNNSPSKMIYVSCDPATGARDWSRLKEKFRLVKVKPFDMFPQTDHVELISVLTDHARLD